MSNNINWDSYFYTRYKPKKDDWSNEDIAKYKRWYKNWLAYIKKNQQFEFKNTKVLEIGCGIGAFVSLLYEEGSMPVGTDISRKILEKAKKISPHIDFFFYNIMETFSYKETYDFVVAFEVLEHVPDVGIAVKNIFKRLKRGGYFIGSTPYPYAKNMTDPTHVNVHLPFFWKTLFMTEGFLNVKTFPLSVPPILWGMMIPRYVPWQGFVSTTLIIAKK